MLIQKKPSAHDVIAIRLSTGEEIIGRLCGDVTDSRTVTVAKPVVVQMQMVAPGQAGIGFAPYMVSVDEAAAITFPADKIVVGPLAVKQEMSAAYTRATSSLAVPGGPASSILGG